jgi:hypothetical protein
MKFSELLTLYIDFVDPLPFFSPEKTVSAYHGKKKIYDLQRFDRNTNLEFSLSSKARNKSASSLSDEENIVANATIKLTHWCG